MTLATLAVACGRVIDPDVLTNPTPSTATADCPELGRGFRPDAAEAGAALPTRTATKAAAAIHRVRRRLRGMRE